MAVVRGACWARAGCCAHIASCVGSHLSINGVDGVSEGLRYLEIGTHLASAAEIINDSRTCS